jgi:uncharacterized protein
MNFLTNFALAAPKTFIWGTVAITFSLMALVAAPTLSPTVAQFLQPLSIDADPENMLTYDEPVRVFNREKKDTFSLYDLIVIGVVNDNHENGVFSVASLSDIYDLTELAKDVQWTNKQGEIEGVVPIDLITPSTMEDVRKAGPGTVDFNWLMDGPPKSEAEALDVRDRALNQPILNGSLVSEDGRSVALYIPITSKGVSYRVAQQLRERIASYHSGDQYWITGLPVAQDQFGVEMFIQMGITTPLATGLLFFLLWFFFRNLTLVASPIMVAMLSVTITVCLLIATGHSIHIMTSMIPIFVMPIAVLDSIHILSEFHDRYPGFKDRRETIKHVMSKLALPMFFTSITTGIGFMSLNFMPIPPLQAFGTFVGIGVVVAWFLTVTLIPAYIILMPERKFKNFGINKTDGSGEPKSFLHSALPALGAGAIRYARPILLLIIPVAAIALYGASQIVANDNPVKWFGKEHNIRQADAVLNSAFGGSYMAYLALGTDQNAESLDLYTYELEARILTKNLAKRDMLVSLVKDISKTVTSRTELLSALLANVEGQLRNAKPGTEVFALENALSFLDAELAQTEIFKDPEVLSYMSNLQAFIEEDAAVGKSNSVVEIVKTVYRELISGEDTDYLIPDSAPGVAQTLITFQNSHRPHDLWHYVTPDYQEANIWVQMKSGDNQDMSRVDALVAQYFIDNPPPRNLTHQWFGLNYINVVWQDYITVGTAKALFGSFIIITLLLMVLFRSVLWGLLAVVPLGFSIAMLYGGIGLVGKSLDAPISILGAISLGLAVDYAIHFVMRSRDIAKEQNNWPDTARIVFGEPARAIARNVLILGVGFLPLLIAPLIPYKVVGVMLSGILILAGIATLIILPALISLLEGRLFKFRPMGVNS